MRRNCWLFALLLLATSCTSVQTNRKMPPPFTLTADEEQNVDRLLARWEQWNAGVKTFDCRFKRWTYDGVFGPLNQPKYVDLGQIKYAAPDHALYRVDTTEKGAEQVPIEEARAERLIFDGAALILWDHAARQITEWKRAPAANGTVALGGPLTLVLGPSMVMEGNAHALKEHYYVREITPPPGAHDEV
jgi:TIGR03009 family protein